MNNIYVDNGFKNRVDYLKSLAFEYDFDENEVYEIANMLGQNEDFDGLITTLEDEYEKRNS